VTSVEPTTVVTGEAAAPPPPPVPESETIEPVPFARHLWDLVTLFDGLSRTDLYQKASFPLGETWREYVRWEGIDYKKAKKPTAEQHRLADQAYLDRAVAQGLERGWFVERGGKIHPATCPPEHTPMQKLGGDRALRAMLHGEDERRAFDLLIDKTGPARHTAIVSKPELRKSLRMVGQLYPILRWVPFGNDPIILDGNLRYEILTKDGKTDDEIVFDDRKNLTAVEALQIRVQAELNSTSKDQRDEARNQYIAELSAAGFTQTSIAKVVSLSQNRVSEILSTVSVDRYRGKTSPDADDVAEFHRLTDAGWNLRAVAEHTGWSKSTVSNYLKGDRTVKTPAPPSTDGEKPKRKRSSKPRTPRKPPGTKSIITSEMVDYRESHPEMSYEELRDGLLEAGLGEIGEGTVSSIDQRMTGRQEARTCPACPIHGPKH
jgi:predicted transcriptional regulator